MAPDLFVLNGFLHDFAVALGLALLVAAWLVGREARRAPEAAAPLSAVRRRLLGGAAGALVAIIATGIVRTIGWRAGLEGPTTWTALLLAKHLVLLAVFGAVVALGAAAAGRRPS